MDKGIRAGVVGFTGFSGAEAVSILRRHPNARPVLLEHRERSAAETPVFDDDLERFPLTPAGLEEARLDVALLATAVEASLETAPLMLDAGVKVIDLSGAFRLRTQTNFQRWYGAEHPREDLLQEAVYGLPEFFRCVVRTARLISNPGCYPTACNLAVRPLIIEAVLDRSFGVICDAKSGVSGAGRKASDRTHFSAVADNFSAYGVMNHRHVPEVLLTSDLEEAEFSFTAHLLPLHRGILETIYARSAEPLEHADLTALYAKHYESEPFVRIYPEGRFPDLHAVQGTNFCDIGFRTDPATRRVTIVAAIDNLVKGAAGQAVQNMNALFGLDETTGLVRAS